MNLTAEIMLTLEEFRDIEFDVLNETLKKVGKETANELKATSPVLRGRNPHRIKGKYAKGWTTKSVSQNGRRVQVVVHNSTEYRLTHLLEYGHIKVLWGKRTHERVPAYPHIKKAEENAIEKLETELKVKL